MANLLQNSIFNENKGEKSYFGGANHEFCTKPIFFLFFLVITCVSSKLTGAIEYLNYQPQKYAIQPTSTTYLIFFLFWLHYEKNVICVQVMKLESHAKKKLDYKPKDSKFA